MKKTRNHPTVVNSFFTKYRTTDSDINLAKLGDDEEQPVVDKPCCAKKPSHESLSDELISNDSTATPSPDE